MVTNTLSSNLYLILADEIVVFMVNLSSTVLLEPCQIDDHVFKSQFVCHDNPMFKLMFLFLLMNPFDSKLDL